MKNINKPWVFLPGWGFNASVFNKVASEFKNINLIDLPKLNDANAIVDQLAKDLPDHSILIAWSFAGLIATLLADRYPEKVEKLMLVATTPKFVNHTVWPGISQALADQFSTLALEKMPNVLSKFLKITQYPNNNRELLSYLKQHTQIDQQLLLNYLTLLFELDVRELYRKIKQPVLLVLGEYDAIVPVAVYASIKALNAEINIQIIKGAGHMPFLTHPHEFIELVYAAS